jgi:hypothetical protein
MAHNGKYVTAIGDDLTGRCGFAWSTTDSKKASVWSSEESAKAAIYTRNRIHPGSDFIFKFEIVEPDDLTSLAEHGII